MLKEGIRLFSQGDLLERMIEENYFNMVILESENKFLDIMDKK